jgi:hypothetical protein
VSGHVTLAVAPAPGPSPLAIRAAFAATLGVAPSRIRLGVLIRERNGQSARLWIVRGRTSSDVCAAIQVGRAQVGASCGGPPVAAAVGIVVTSDDATVIGGVAASTTARVRVWFGKRGARTLTARAGAWLAVQTRHTHATRVATLDARGNVTATRPL